MRWPLLESPAADGNPIDQDQELVDYAIAHGVNIFPDTAPVYIRGFSGKIDGIALKTPSAREGVHRHEDVQSLYGRAGNAPARISGDSEERYWKSLRDLQTDFVWITICCTLWAATRASRLSTNVLSTAACSTFCCASARAGRIRNSVVVPRRSEGLRPPAGHARQQRRGGISSRSR